MMKIDKIVIKSSWSFILVVVGFIFIVELTEELITPILQDFIKINQLNGIIWIALSAPLIWWFVKYRNRSQEELLENEERFRSVVQTANDAIILMDNNGNIVSWNNCAQKMFGYESREILGRSLSILLPEPYGEAHKKILESINSTEESNVIGKTIEASGRKKDGSDFAIEYSVSTWSSKHGRFYTGIIRDVIHSKFVEESLAKCEERFRQISNYVALHDITERKRAEKALHHAYTEKAEIFNSIGNVTLLLDPQHNIVAANRAAVKALGKSEEELIGKKCYELLHENSWIPEICPLEKMLHPNILEISEMEVEALNGIYLVSCTPVFNENGSLKNIIHMATDITQRKLIEKERENAILKARDEQNKTEAIISALPDGIIIQDTNYIITYQSPLQIEIYGEHTGEHCYKVYEGRDTICEDCPIEKTFLDGKIYRSERNILIDGKTSHFELTSSPLKDSSGKIIAGIKLVRDISERKIAEENIKASLKEKEILLREIHHRVKNNMQVISSLLGLTSGTITDKKYVDMFQESQNRINSMSLVHENLYLSKDLAKINFNEYIKDLTGGLFRSHGTKAGTIELNLNIENVSLGIDQAIPCGLIINELITNSLKYAFPQGRKGEIFVSAHHNDENMIEIIVSDNGVGIPSDMDFRKTGSLGLHLVTILAQDQLKGKIDLDRSKGTEFRIIFNGSK